MLAHRHLILAVDCKYPPKDAEEAEYFIQFLIKRVDMSVAKDPSLVKNPHSYYCRIPGNEGVTATGILETSHCALHTWNNEYPAKFQFDLYSCKEFDIPFVIDLVNSFGIMGGTYMVLDRDTNLKVLESGILGENGMVLKGGKDVDTNPVLSSVK